MSKYETPRNNPRLRVGYFGLGQCAERIVHTFTDMPVSVVPQAVSRTVNQGTQQNLSIRFYPLKEYVPDFQSARRFMGCFNEIDFFVGVFDGSSTASFQQVQRRIGECALFYKETTAVIADCSDDEVDAAVLETAREYCAVNGIQLVEYDATQDLDNIFESIVTRSILQLYNDDDPRKAVVLAWHKSHQIENFCSLFATISSDDQRHRVIGDEPAGFDDAATATASTSDTVLGSNGT